jgi:excisionase family DNA binding protein
MIEQHELMTLPSAAKLMGIGTSTIYRYVDAGILPVALRTPTGTMRVRRSDVERCGNTPIDVGTRRSEKNVGS